MVNINELKIGLIGGTGEEGRGLALRLAGAGAQVVIGSRTIEKAKTAADEINQTLEGNPVGYALNKDAVSGSEFVLLAVPFQYAASTLESVAEDFRADSILIDITVPVSFEQGRVR